MSQTHPDYDPHLRIKEEPAIESQHSEESVVRSVEFITNIKTEPQQSNNSISGTTRLPSFRVPRDLTLGGNLKIEKPKKTYAPNVLAQRLKDREDSTSTSKNESSQKDGKAQIREKRKTDRSKERDKTKNRGKTNNLVQSSGVFSEGLADSTIKKYSTRSGGAGSFKERGTSKETSSTLERPKLSVPVKIDKTEEAEKLKKLLKDDLIENESEIDWTKEPVSLPLGKRTGSNNKFSPPQIKTEDKKLPLTISQIMEDLPNTFVFIQLPDCLPGHLNDDSQNNHKTKRSTESSTENESDKFCRLKSLNEGMLGKLQILKSGKARLKLGENNLLIQPRSGPSFRQDLIAAEIKEDKQSGELINIGTVNSSLVLTPDWINLLKKL